MISQPLPFQLQLSHFQLKFSRCFDIRSSASNFNFHSSASAVNFCSSASAASFCSLASAASFHLSASAANLNFRISASTIIFHPWVKNFVFFFPSRPIFSACRFRSSNVAITMQFQYQPTKKKFPGRAPKMLRNIQEGQKNYFADRMIDKHRMMNRKT